LFLPRGLSCGVLDVSIWQVSPSSVSRRKEPQRNSIERWTDLPICFKSILLSSSHYSFACSFTSPFNLHRLISLIFLLSLPSPTVVVSHALKTSYTTNLESWHHSSTSLRFVWPLLTKTMDTANRDSKAANILGVGSQAS
jgi:hypothetical protein